MAGERDQPEGSAGPDEPLLTRDPDLDRLRVALRVISIIIEAAPYHRDYRAACVDIAAELAALAPEGSAGEFVGQMTWPCTCSHPKADHYFGDQLDERGQMHTSCQRHDGCHLFVPAPEGSAVRARLTYGSDEHWHREGSARDGG